MIIQIEMTPSESVTYNNMISEISNFTDNQNIRHLMNDINKTIKGSFGQIDTKENYICLATNEDTSIEFMNNTIKIAANTSMGILHAITLLNLTRDTISKFNEGWGINKDENTNIIK